MFQLQRNLVPSCRLAMLPFQRVLNSPIPVTSNVIQTASFSGASRNPTPTVMMPKAWETFKTKFARTGNNLAVENSLFAALKIIKKRTKINPIYFFFEVIEKVRFSIMLQVFEKKRKKTLTKKVIPKLIKSWARYKAATQILAKSIKLRKELKLHDKIANELVEIAIYNKSNTFLKKQEIYNYAHFFQYKTFTS